MPRKTTTKRIVAAKTVTPRSSSKKAEKPKESKAAKVTPQTQSTEKKFPQVDTKNPRLWIGLGIVVLAILLYALRGLFFAATVNGQPITRIAVVQQLEKQSGKDALNSLVSQTLIQQEAQKRHIAVSQSEVNGDISKIENTLKGQGITLDQALAARGLSRQDLEQQIRLQLVLNKMVGSNVKVTDQQVQDYIDKNKDTLPTDLSDDQLRAQVRQQLEQQQLQTTTQKFLADLQKKAQITTFVSY